MIRFLLKRPIAVLMAFTACFIVGIITYFTLPVSLLPDIPIPEITVQVSAPNTSARELENTVLKPIRQQLLQVAHLKDIESEARDAGGLIRLNFAFGTNTDLAFIEVNEKIDASMNRLPAGTERPKVIKASATDIPVFYLSLTLKSDSAYAPVNEKAFLDLCNFAESNIKRRIEQLPEVAMADITGLLQSQLQIVPDVNKMEILNLNISDLENVLHSNNIEPGSMRVKDGYYEYNIRFSTLLRTPQDVENIFIRKNDRILQLKEIAEVKVVPQKENGLSLFNGKRAVTLAIIKQADENMDQMKDALQGVTDHFIHTYPDIEFHISRNQTELLDYTIENLQENLWIGFILICLVAIWFLGDVRSPLIIGITMVVAIVITFLFFYLFGRSLNVISISGLILALGMMIDSSIIVTENISQYREKGYSLHRACVAGVNEVITPILSSSLTTIAVFIPLVFMSGISGAIFFDQAFAISIGLFVSYFTGIILLPVLYSLFYHRKARKSGSPKNRRPNRLLFLFYDRGIEFVFRYPKSTLVFCFSSLFFCVFFFTVLGKGRMPEIDQRELVMRIDWNENIHAQENMQRVNRIFQLTAPKVTEQSADVGKQDYLLNSAEELSPTEAILYFKTETTEEIPPLQELLTLQMKKAHPEAVVSFAPPSNLFEQLFNTGDAELVAELQYTRQSKSFDMQELKNFAPQFEAISGSLVSAPPFENQLNIRVNQEKLLLYRVSYNELYRTLRTAFKENSVAILRSYQQYLPIYINGEENTVESVLQETLLRTEVTDDNGVPLHVPLRDFIEITPAEDLKSISAGKNGEYIPFEFFKVNNPEEVLTRVSDKIKQKKDWEVQFSGNYFSNKEMISEMIVILFVSILLMYFVLAAQFESFLQPLVVLVEIPIDVAFALLLLWITGHTINLMSAIGIVVTCGIIINDSILKIDAINELRKEGMPLMEAIHEAGHRRLRPIIMTSLTTMLAMVPLLFSFDMGSELQKPLSISMIGAMSIGTLVSLFVVPYMYWLIYRKKERTPAN